jgi:hypothetical protein
VLPEAYPLLLFVPHIHLHGVEHGVKMLLVTLFGEVHPGEGLDIFQSSEMACGLHLKIPK